MFFTETNCSFFVSQVYLNGGFFITRTANERSSLICQKLMSPIITKKYLFLFFLIASDILKIYFCCLHYVPANGKLETIPLRQCNRIVIGVLYNLS